MAKKTPEEKIAELNKMQEKVEHELKQKREAIVTAKRREQAKILNQTRKEDTRRKILVGALIFDDLDKVADEHKPAEKRKLKEKMSRFLTRKDDRALFGLPPLEAEEKTG